MQERVINMSVNISEFIQWFIEQFVNIGKRMISIIDNIIIYQNISLLDLIIAIVILGMFLELILTIPNNAMNKAERNVREYKAEERRKEWKNRKK